MVQRAPSPEAEKMTARITFYTRPSVQERLDRAVETSPWDQPDFLRHWLEDSLRNLELAEFEGTEIDQQQIEELPLAVQVAALQAENSGLRGHINLLNERLGMADAQNIDLNSSLKISLGTVDRVTRALPAAPHDQQHEQQPLTTPQPHIIPPVDTTVTYKEDKFTENVPEAHNSERTIANRTRRRSFLEMLRLTRPPNS